jgi:hypothetical protein
MQHEIIPNPQRYRLDENQNRQKFEQHGQFFIIHFEEKKKCSECELSLHIRKCTL